ncbi:putative protein kinase RLK-Pelle-LRR-I-1 family [Helianthus annuus]|nr:putative protein kinase RLK-Pelle-LRR-I-1 family [Helianthus annuus]
MASTIDELEKAQEFQLGIENQIENKDNLRIPLEDIKRATQNFHNDNLIGVGGFGKVYKGDLQDGDGFKTIVAKRLDTRFGQGEQQFLSELQILLEYKHENVIGLLGYCDENDEKVIVYEYASRGSLDRYLNDASLTWVKRLNICIDVARALDFLHGGVGRQAKVIHRDIKSENILLNYDWKAKLVDFGLSLISPLNPETDYVIDHACGTRGYLDPLYRHLGFLTRESDIYSFGVVLFEMLCGRSTFEVHKHEGHYLPDFIKNRFQEGNHDEVVFEPIREQIAPKSLVTFQKIAYQCLHHEREKRPTTKEVLMQLKKALEFQNMELTMTKLAHLQIPLKYVVKATNNFHHDNIIRQGGFCTAYKGRLLRLGRVMQIVAKRFDFKHAEGDLEFLMKISMLSDLKHKNIVSFIGFCHEKDEKIIVTTYEANGSLRHYLHDPNLTWTQRLRICTSVARALSFLHYDEERDYAIIHCNINSDTILLDENWEAKLSGFEFSIKQVVYYKDQVYLGEQIGKMGYMDPAIEKTGGVTHKSDVYSFGVVLFEILCGRNAFIENEANRFLAPLAKYHYENRTLEDVIHPDLWNQMFPQSLVRYSKAAYSCLNDERADRPDMNHIVNQLEKALELQVRRENLEMNFEHLKIRLSDIKLATDNFSQTYIIGSTEYHTLYRVELDHFGEGYPSHVEGKNKGKLSKRQSTVIIKRMLPIDDEQEKERYFTEVETLTRVKHYNIVTLLGFCAESHEMIIVIENVSKGYLSDYLEKVNDMHILTWEKRLKISIDVAHALNYLHCGMEDEKIIISRGIMSNNIGLDENWRAKIVDFGLSLFLSPNQQDEALYLDTIVGTGYYKDPQYSKTGKLKTESDVYSFGALLFEILCGGTTCDPIWLAYVAKRSFHTGTLENMMDPIIKGETDENNFLINRGPDKDSLHTFIEIAHQCVAETQDQRPTMKVVIEELEKALFHQINRQLAPLEIRLEKILSATNNFADENLIKESGFYKGQMLESGKLIDICARRLKRKYGHGDIEFQTEISMLSSLKHKNIISFIGFCDEDDEKIIIYEHAVHGSLDQHLRGLDLTWSQRLKICLGVALALRRIHYDVIHCDINSSKILLDDNWEPKVFGFEASTKYPQSWWHRFDNTDRTPKHDVYSFGVLLFEVACGKKPMFGDHGVNEELEDIIDPKLRKQMDEQSLVNFTKITYNCLKENPVQRPTVDQIVKELEDVLELQWKHENLGHSPAADEATALNHRLKLEWLKIPLSDIRLATNNFDQAHFVGSGGYGIVYKAELDVLDIQNFSSIEGKCKDELPKRRRTVAIKCINDRQDDGGKQGFLAEIELLTSCNHPNIVSLLGFCSEGNVMVLVYEYAFKGSLNDYFGDTSEMINLTWAQRIQICLDIAYGINYLHTNMEGKPRIIHRDIKSDNILLDENLNAKIADFGLSKFHSTNKKTSTIYTKHIAGTEVYMDPEYLTSSKYKKESDIYSFGVVLFETLCGRPAYDLMYMSENVKGLAPIARRRYNEGTLKELIDPKMIEEDDKSIFTLNRGPNQDSFNVFSGIAYECLAETQAKRPTMEAVIKELQNALSLQGETMVLSKFWLKDILQATENFSEKYCIGLYEYGTVYTAELDNFDNKSSLAFEEKNGANTHISVAIKRSSSTRHVKQRFFSEIEMRSSYKHRNIVSLLGFCDEDNEIILVYEHASNNSLDDYLKNVNNMDNLTWTQRLNMCLGIAHGLNHLHTKMGSQKRVIHGDIRSANILLGKNLEPKIAYFGVSKFQLANQDASSLICTKVYCDPEFDITRMQKKESDIFSFGVILLEIFCGRLAYDSSYIDENDKGLASIARSGFNDGAIKKLLDPKLIKEVTDDIITSNKGPNQDSLDTFLKIADQCLEEDQAKRPTMETVIKELEIALNFQVNQYYKENKMKSLQISLKDIELATESFSPKNRLGNGRYWEAYKGNLPDASATTIVAKRWDSKFDDLFWKELDILFKCKHKNIIHLVGYCNEPNEKIIVYEHMSKGSLDKYFKDSNLRWMKRLEICIDVASALEFLHVSDVTQWDIKSHGILLNDNWDAKISNFEVTSLHSPHQDMEHIRNDVYLDRQYKQGFLNEKSDIYSFGVVLFEILCGRLEWVEGHEDSNQSLGPLAKHYYEQGKLDEIVFDDIKKQIVPESLTTFANIAHRCLDEDGHLRPEASEVVTHLKKALEFQEEFEIWEPKLPKDYKEIMRLSQTPEISGKKDTYKKLSNGILLKENKKLSNGILLKENVWYKLSDNGEANKIISATTAKYSYNNHESHKFRSIHISRFRKVAKLLDISNLKFQVTVDNRFLSLDVTYGIYLVFKFSDPRVFSRNHMFMNLKYKNGNETLHSYFATWRDEEWMMIELHRFLNHKEDVSFTFLLESFSRYYCGSGAIYIEGIEFRAIKKMAHEDNKNQKEVQQVQKSSSALDQLLTVNEKIYLRELNGKKHLLLSAIEVLYNSTKWKPFQPKQSVDSRFPEVMELLPQQVFRIKYKIETEMLSPFIEYACYIVFKVSEKCRGLHCPVKIRDLLYRRNKENQIIYFRSPDLLNHHDDFSAPEQRTDGWMEVMVWKFNSKHDKFGKSYIPMNLKLITYEGTMSGLRICGLEFRPM